MKSDVKSGEKVASVSCILPPHSTKKGHDMCGEMIYGNQISLLRCLRLIKVLIFMFKYLNTIMLNNNV